MTRTVPFTSKRERRPRGWALAALTAIYSTAWLAGSLAQLLRGRDLLRAGLIATMASMGLARARRRDVFRRYRG